MSRAIALLLAAALAAAALGARARAAGLFATVVADEDRFYLPPAGWLRVFSVGYNEAVADLVWVATIVYFGERATFAQSRAEAKRMEEAEAAKFTVNYLAVVTSLDPRFRRAYNDGAKLTLYHRGGITRRATEMAIDLLRSGRAQFPEDGEMAFSLGFLYYYELPAFLPQGSPALKEARALGAREMRAAAALPGVPEYVATMSTALLRREGMDELVIEHLRNMLLRETSPNIRATLEAQLRRELGRAAERDIARTRELTRRWRAEMPYAPFDLFLLLEPGAPWSLAAALEPSAIEPPPPADDAADAGAPPADGPP